MKLYLLQVEMYEYDAKLFDTSSYCNVYSSFEKAKEAGLQDLTERIKQVEENENMTFAEMLKKEKLDYSFQITRDRRFSICRKFYHLL